jgi:Peptidase family C25
LRKLVAIIILLSFGTIFAAGTKADIAYPTNQTLVASIDLGEFDAYTWTEGDKEFLRYSFDRSNNIISLDDLSYEILQYPIAIADKIPTINVTVLSSKDFEHHVSDNTLYHMSDVRQFRDKRFVYLTINPFLKNGKVASKIEINIDFHQSTGRKIEDKNNRLFLNSDFAAGMNSESLKSLRSLKKTTSFTGEWLDVKVSEEGIYSLTKADLQNAGVSGTIDDNDFYLFAGPGFGAPLRDYFPDSVDFHLKQIPLLFMDAASDEDDKWVFYASPTSTWERETDITDLRYIDFIRNPYESEQHFRLFIGSGNGSPLRMAQESPAFTGSEDEQLYTYKRLHYEEELINPGKGGELWFGQRLASSENFPFYLNNLFTDQHTPAAIHVGYGMVTSGAHQFSSFVGDSLIDDTYATISKTSDDYDYASSISRQREYILPNSLLSEDLNVRITYQGQYQTSEGYLDYIDIIYPALPQAIDGQLSLWFMKNERDRKIHVTGLNAAMSYVFSTEDPFAVQYYPVSGTETDLLVPASNVSSSYLIANEGHFKTPSNISLLPDYEPLLSQDHASQTDFIIITPDAFVSEANRLANFKESRSIQPLTALVKTYSEIVGQYNAGNRDPYAIRHFLADMYRQAPAPKPLYVLLLGDGHFDYQNRTYAAPNYIPYLYEPNILWPCDDIFVMVNSIDDPINDMAVGRIPVNSANEARAAVDKIIEYDSRENAGEWQLNAMLVADDPTDLAQGYPFINQTVFVSDSEYLYRNHLPKVMQTKKVYLTEYPERYITELQTMGRDGAREDIMETFLKGVSFVNFYGHGDPSVWTQEKVFVSNDLIRLDVDHQYPLIIAATCSWGRSDNPDFQSMAEDIVTLEANGAIATLATVRSVYHTGNIKFVKDFTTGLFEGNPHYAYSPLMGDAVLYAKNESNNPIGSSSKISNNMKFMYFGDPTIIPAFPQNAGMIDTLSRDTLRALDRVTVEGRALERDGNDPGSRNLHGKITIYDNDYRVSREYVSNTSGNISTISYYLEGNRLFNGNISFNNNSFSTEVFIPKDIQYHGLNGKVRMIYWNDDNTFDGSAAIDDIHVGGINPDALADVQGPVISFYQGSLELQNGAVVFDTSSLNILFEDQSGINITGSTGHVLEMSIDNGQQLVDLSDLFAYDQNDYTQGLVEIPISNYFDEGEHLIEISAFDNYNNYSQVELTINVLQEDDELVQNMVNFPNPFKGQTDITFSTAFSGLADLKIYSISGKPVASLQDIDINSGFNAIPVRAEDDYGHPLAAGVYFYVLELHTGTEIIKQHNKMVVLP